MSSLHSSSSSPRSFILPGQELGGSFGGDGTYTHQGDIHSLFWGTFGSSRHPSSTATVTSVTPAKFLPYPNIDSIVLVRVTKVSPRWANVIILSVNGVPLPESGPNALAAFRAIIRQQDIRSTEKDKVTVYDSFRPGDIVRAQIVGLGESGGNSGAFFLSTAKNELGVVQARNPANNGQLLVPLSWSQMQDPVSKQIFLRKVAAFNTKK